MASCEPCVHCCFRRRLEESTAAFQTSSGIVRHILTLLEEAGEQPALVEGLRAVQKHEQAKLRYTLILQVLFPEMGPAHFEERGNRTPHDSYMPASMVLVHAVLGLHKLLVIACRR